MYVRNLYDNFTILQDDIRTQEVKNLLGVFGVGENDKDVQYLVYIDVYNVLYIIIDNAIVYRIQLSIPATADTIEVAFDGHNYKHKEDDTNYLILDRNVLYYAQNTINKVYQYTELVASIDDLKDNERFQQLLALKSTDNMEFFKVPSLMEPGKNYYVPVFGRFPYITSKDLLSLQIYNDSFQYTDCKQLVVVYNIYKDKFKRNIQMMYKILDIDQTLTLL